MLAMHMADTLLTPKVAWGLIVASAVVLVLAGRRTQRELDPARVPLMGVLGAFVFAAQMINFPLPLVPGTSGHLGGGLLLAILLGPHAAVLVMASILIVQCLFFQDGGLLALGANIFNLGVVPCYVGYGVYRLVAGASPGPGRAYAALFVAALIGVTAGAALVPFQVRWSGLVAVPFSEFLLAMIGLHLLIAVVEAFITFGVVGYVARVRPEAVAAAGRWAQGEGRLSTRAVAGSLLVAALLLAGVVSLYASSSPDALESKLSMVRANTDETIQKVEGWHERIAPLPDYEGIAGWSSAGGVIGTLATLMIVWLAARALRARSSANPSDCPLPGDDRTGQTPVPH
ncbi:MAG TPA: energy-coupling factor ABC transporter permease [Phycisphaerae bacterium]|jgi:cobalt/nickel transport system permease protein|nr:energy-coupling factor ABC transporter permease [Phycisphaerae bacterium]HOJ53845.1 energy-coupling factor ABC transporter permease [Phycisphaerae bacterium]HOL26176.1 energy-coupling factor ABC transporter permease [Phycisphaerae bacterium]HPP20163.1 energy-coupling factor ABC transporter permease [Phycisphaerae bacterium]HPU33744.1 energy-coupling factor ABC transporter permease [Phycisphaerae bacterium]